jgi:hypothetical protein
MKTPILTFLLISVHFLCVAQVNGYAKVTSIAGSVLSVSNVNETFDTFEIGEQIIIIQIQDDVIGANTTNASTFGDLSAIVNAGKYEVRTISNITETMSVPTSITITPALGNTYSTGGNSSLQIVTFPQLGTPNFTTTANITAVNWNGNVGGIVAFQVTGNLTLANNITANGAGFRGGAVSVNYYPGGTTCDTVAGTWMSGLNIRAEKGEGIYLRTNSIHRYGKAKILNGGGGGVNINAGGGGGGNYTAGGNSSGGWNGSGTGCNGPEGRGGISLSANISASKVFMGGGGGGGQQNNSQATAGGNGGGLIFIKATQIITTGTCGGRTISANGSAAATSGIDGSGGGGAGGSIVLEVGSYSINSGCPLTISSNGGDGGDVGNSGTHAGGGGGGQGTIIFLSAQPTTNTTVQTNNGIGGVINSGSSTTAQNGQGTNGSGIISNSPTPLPIELLNFSATLLNSEVKLTWTTLTETNNDFFTIERTTDGINFEYLFTVDGAGNSNATTNYSTTDDSPLSGQSYYRLKQTDFDGNFTYSALESIYHDKLTLFSVYPNPAQNNLTIILAQNIKMINVSISNNIGQEIYNTMSNKNYIELSTTEFAEGTYYVKVITDSQTQVQKIIIKK